MSVFSHRPSAASRRWRYTGLAWVSILSATACLSLDVAAAAADALDRRIAFHIPSQPLDAALMEFSRQANVQLAIDARSLDSIQAPELNGSLVASAALTQLLQKTGLAYYTVGQTVTVTPAAGKSDARALSASTSAHSDAEDPGSSRSISKDGYGADGSQGDARRRDLEEVVVTAQKREERLIDTPQSVSVLTADELGRLGAVQFRDYANTVPGLSFTTAGAGFTQISLRGVTTGRDTSPTVGIYVDDVPFGSSTGFAQGAQLALDVGLFDVNRIEVLRGPQGTLYGASTMGGLIKYVSIQPDTNKFSGNAQAGVSSTGGVSYNVAAGVNLPISADKAALRLSAFQSRDGGYVENVVLGRKDVNRSDINGGRLDFLLTPTDALSIRLGAFAQNITRNGLATVDYTVAGAPINSTLQQSNPLDQPFSEHFRLVSGTVGYNFGVATLTSISSYQTMRADVFYDYSRQFAPLLNSFGLGPYGTVGDAQKATTNKFTQEVRVASQSGQAFEWLAGGFYTRESSANTQAFVLQSLQLQPLPNDLYTVFAPSLYKEYAAYADVTYHFTSKLDASGGVRYAHNKQEYTQNGSGLLIGSEPTSGSSGNVSTYLANVRYHFNDDTTAYVRYATGYRPGGPNFVARDPATGLLVAPLTFEPDRLKSYEAGLKAETADRKFGFDFAAYYIDWTNIQVLTSRGGFSVYANAGGAKVRGAELTLTARPIPGLTAAGTFAYQDAYLSEAAPDVGGADGERLPNVPHGTAALNGDYVLWEGNLHPSIGATLRYVSDRMATFNGNASPQYRLPAYTTFDLRGGLQFGAVNAQLYVHNLFDKRGQLSAFLTTAAAAAPGSPGSVPVAILQPRTVGLQLSMAF